METGAGARAGAGMETGGGARSRARPARAGARRGTRAGDGASSTRPTRQPARRRCRDRPIVALLTSWPHGQACPPTLRASERDQRCAGCCFRACSKTSRRRARQTGHRPGNGAAGAGTRWGPSGELEEPRAARTGAADRGARREAGGGRPAKRRSSTDLRIKL